MKQLSLGFSPCPNDTFIFHGLVNGLLGLPEPKFTDPFLEDVETLNQWSLEARLDVTKLSFNAAAHVLDEYCILQSGSALGRGCGPLLVATRNMDEAELSGCRVGIPGIHTTAALMFRMFMPAADNLVEMRFEQIMPALVDGSIDVGVIIHESRFTYQRFGLVCVQDLGELWEAKTGLPIPLGCIAARRSLGRDQLMAIDHSIRSSLEHARSNPEQCMEYVRRYAQETEDEVVMSHIDLYVNDFSLDLGLEGRGAVEHFFSRGRAVGVLPDNKPPPFCREQVC